MPTNDRYTVNLRQIEREDLRMELQLDDDFFQQEQDEILGGKGKGTLSVRFGAADTFTFHFRVEGEVAVRCDRCLEPLTLPFSIDDVVRVAYDEEQSDAELILVPYSQLSYNYAWDLMELLLLELPLQRVHPEGGCNPEMLSRFSIEQDSDEEDYDFDA